MKLKGHRNNPYFLYLFDIQYHKLPLLLESNIWGRVATPVKLGQAHISLSKTFILCILALKNRAGQSALNKWAHLHSPLHPVYSTMTYELVMRVGPFITPQHRSESRNLSFTVRE